MDIRIDPITIKPDEVSLTRLEKGEFCRLVFRTGRDQVDIWFPREAFESLRTTVKLFGVPYRINRYNKDNQFEILENWEPPKERG